jgi:hypothetical protein
VNRSDEIRPGPGGTRPGIHRFHELSGRGIETGEHVRGHPYGSLLVFEDPPWNGGRVRRDPSHWQPGVQDVPVAVVPHQSAARGEPDEAAVVLQDLVEMLGRNTVESSQGREANVRGVPGNRSPRSVVFGIARRLSSPRACRRCYEDCDVEQLVSANQFRTSFVRASEKLDSSKPLRRYRMAGGLSVTPGSKTAMFKLAGWARHFLAGVFPCPAKASAIFTARENVPA